MLKNSANKFIIVVSERLRSSESLFFFNGSSRKFFTSLDAYFVLLKQLASFSSEWRTPKNHFVFCLKKLNHPASFAYKSYTYAVIPVRNIFQVFPNHQKSYSLINTLCGFLSLNYGKKVGLLRVTRFMPKASMRFFRNEWCIFRKTITKVIFLFQI